MQDFLTLFWGVNLEILHFFYITSSECFTAISWLIFDYDAILGDSCLVPYGNSATCRSMILDLSRVDIETWDTVTDGSEHLSL